MSKPLIATVIGARPQFVKAGPVSREFRRRDIDEVLINTGQHYDPVLSADIARDVGLREADLNLGVGSGSQGVQTGTTLIRIEEALLDIAPSTVVVFGDTNATIAGALAAAKLHIPVAHVEAGLRSFNRRMPEELNRIVTDHLADLLLVPTETAMANLEREGLRNRSILVGDVMVDALQSIPLDRVTLPGWAQGRFFAATLHRAENTDEPDRLRSILKALGALDAPVHLLAHPRLRARVEEHRIDTVSFPSLVLHDPLPYAQMLAVVSAADVLLTDSGGLQKEAFILGTRCITLRTETEWPETTEGDWNVVAGGLLDSLGSLVTRQPAERNSAPFGHGDAASRIVEEVLGL